MPVQASDGGFGAWTLESRLLGAIFNCGLVQPTEVLVSSASLKTVWLRKPYWLNWSGSSCHLSWSGCNPCRRAAARRTSCTFCVACVMCLTRVPCHQSTNQGLVRRSLGQVWQPAPEAYRGESSCGRVGRAAGKRGVLVPGERLRHG